MHPSNLYNYTRKNEKADARLNEKAIILPTMSPYLDSFFYFNRNLQQRQL